MTKTNLLNFVLTLCICSSVFGQDPELVERDPYFEVLFERAEGGEAGAQLLLGRKYANGNGVPEDDVEAVKWYRLAADQGNAIAQNKLGLMYANGEGVPEDDVESYARYNVAVALGSETAKGLKETLTARMSKEDISAAQKRSKEIWEALEGRKAD